MLLGSFSVKLTKIEKTGVKFLPHTVDTGRKWTVHKTSRTSSEHLMYGQFTSCVRGAVSFFKIMLTGLRNRYNNMEIHFYQKIYHKQWRFKIKLTEISSNFKIRELAGVLPFFQISKGSKKDKKKQQK